MEEALRFSASSVVVVHNHPSGEVTPSEHDVETTRMLKQSAEILQIVICFYGLNGSSNGGLNPENGRLKPAG